MKKAKHQTSRDTVSHFEEIVNIGPAFKRDFERLGLKSPQDLVGVDPIDLYRRICTVEKKFHDPCVLDCYLAAVDFMNGNPPQVWWNFTEHRKRDWGHVVQEMRSQFQ